MQYHGELKDGRMHGQGVLTFANGIVYEGPFVDGKREGMGRMVCGLLLANQRSRCSRNIPAQMALKFRQS